MGYGFERIFHFEYSNKYACPVSNFQFWSVEFFILVPANGHGRLLLLFLVQEPHECVTLLCGGGSLFLGLVVLCWVWGLGFGVWGGG